MDRDALAIAVKSRAPWCRPDVFEATLELALEIAREGREGRHIGTLFTVGRADAVLDRSRPLILDPVADKARELRHIRHASLRGTIKELAQLDGAFVVEENGLVVGACRYLDVPAMDIDLPMGLGSRHVAAAAVSKALGIIAIVVSQDQTVRVFHRGELLSEHRPD